MFFIGGILLINSSLWNSCLCLRDSITAARANSSSFLPLYSVKKALTFGYCLNFQIFFIINYELFSHKLILDFLIENCSKLFFSHFYGLIILRKYVICRPNFMI